MSQNSVANSMLQAPRRISTLYNRENVMCMGFTDDMPTPLMKYRELYILK